MKTYSPKPQDIERRWYVIDASGAVLGRLASEAAAILRGKHKPIFAPHADTGDHVIVVNAKDVELTGGKEARSSPTGTRVPRRLDGDPIHAPPRGEARLRGREGDQGHAPKNRLGRAMAKKLQVYAGPSTHTPPRSRSR